ncbi:MAG: hypothetical protein KAG43_06010 [Candidatus Marithrix sp.]|nr:hypothetical protein [Candidatus Marithrix sp.]
MQTTDIMLHIDEQLESKQQQILENDVRKLEGVIAPRFNRPHLFLVSYNPEKVKSLELLNFVTARGYNCQLVGM